MSTPNTLVALVFDDSYKADEARAALLRMGGEGLLTIDETAVLACRTQKDIRVTQDANLAAKGQSIGRIVGAIASVVVPVPLLRPLGAHLGGRIADRLDQGITNRFIKDVKKELQDGTSVLILMVRDARQYLPQITERLRGFHPTILQSEFSPEEEAALVGPG
jgi:uncharacterized membrane protein